MFRITEVRIIEILLYIANHFKSTLHDNHIISKLIALCSWTILSWGDMHLTDKKIGRLVESLKNYWPKFLLSNFFCVLLNCQMADRYFLEFSYVRILKTRIEKYSTPCFFSAMMVLPTLFHRTESQFAEFIKVRFIHRGLFEELFLK